MSNAPVLELQKLNISSTLISLFKVDLTRRGGPIYYFTDVLVPEGHVTWQGIEHMCLPIGVEGFDFSATGAPPKPSISFSNVNGILLPDVVTLGDLVGCRMERRRIFAKNLDTGSDPRYEFLGPDIYIVDQRMHNKKTITFNLASPLDRAGIKLPRRQVLKDKGFPGVSRTRAQ